MSQVFRSHSVIRSRAVALALAGPLILVVAGCNVSKRTDKDGQKRVDIETPVGSIHVNQPTSASDTGLPEYAGAKPSEGTDENKSANVNIDTSKFGLKVVAVKFQTDDTPEQVLDFYRQKMKKMGPVSECHGSFDLNVNHKGQQQEVRCEEKSGETDLMVGDAGRHRVVSVKPNGKGTKFELVFVQTRGERELL